MSALLESHAAPGLASAEAAFLEAQPCFHGLDELRVGRLADHLDEAHGPSLVAYPAQSNFSGVKHPLEYRFMDLAAEFVDLTDVPSDLPPKACLLVSR